MKWVLIVEGERFRIEAIDLSDERPEAGCPARDFIDGLPEPTRKRMVAILNRHASHGPILNQQVSRDLDDGICEFKTPQGARVLWFYPGGPRLTVLTHGFQKGSRLRAEIVRAKAYRAAYLRAFPAR